MWVEGEKEREKGLTLLNAIIATVDVKFPNIYSTYMPRVFLSDSDHDCIFVYFQYGETLKLSEALQRSFLLSLDILPLIYAFSHSYSQPPMHSSIHSFISQMFIWVLLCSRHCSWHTITGLFHSPKDST
jgi:hypothetical protein